MTMLTVLTLAAAGLAAPAPQQQGSLPDRWALTDSGKTIEWRVDSDTRLPHADKVEMAGRNVALLFDYAVSESRTLTLSRRLVWPRVRFQPNNTHGSMFFDFLPTNGLPQLTADGKVVSETVSRISFSGIWTSAGTTASGLRVERRIFPSAKAPAAFERWIVTNNGKAPVVLGVTTPAKSWIKLGCVARYVITAAVTPSAPQTLAPGQTAEATLAFSIRPTGEAAVSYDGAREERARQTRLAEITNAVRLETDNPVLDAMFRFAKIRAGESIFDTAGGPMHGPGGGSYYAATWCNDQVEYAGPWFAFTGDDLALLASLNAYRHYMPFMAEDYAPIPSSVIAEGRDYWNGAGDRGDAAMWAYGASRFVLAAGRRDWAEFLRPGLRWTLEYCRRKLTADGVVASKTDELEGRLPTGQANLNTSTLYYDALLHAAIIERTLENGKLADEYEARARELARAIERYFGAEIHGFRTYRYYDGCKILRSWIGIPLCAGLFDRAEGTTAALLSPYLRTRDAGILSAEGDPSGVTWDRSQLYAFRGIFAAGLADRAWADFLRYAHARLLGEHVPYAVEAWPEGDRRHLAAESALFCRAVTEGLFGLDPNGFGSFKVRARLPAGLKRMALRNIRTQGRAFDVVVDATGTKVEPAQPVPSAALQRRLDAGQDIIGIVHWGLNTFTDREWGFGNEDPKALNPDAFDANQIVAACKAAGICGLVVVAKHHDGFCLWPTKTTEHNITKSPFRNGKGDYVGEMCAACRRAGLMFGVYCSPWDRNNAGYATPQYVETFHAQVRELNDGRYGDIFEMWFDGANGGGGWYGGAGGGKGEKRKIAPGYYRFPELLAYLRSVQPGITFFGGDKTGEYAWPGNERGQVDPKCDATKYGVFRQWEADFPLRPGWFYHASEKGKTKSAAYLLNRYLSSVGNGGTMNIGIAPNRHGLLDGEDVKAIEGFGALRRAFFSRPVKEGERFNVVVTRNAFGVKRILQTATYAGPGERYWVDPALLKLANEATTESGETDTAKWMTR